MKNIEEVKTRIAKLLNLSKSSNSNEAEIAMQNAQKLAMTYQLDLADALAEESAPEEPFEDKLVFTWGREPVIWKHVCHILQDYYNVKIIYTHGYCEKQVKFVGRTSDIENAKVISNFLLRTFGNLWKDYKKINNLRNSYKYSYLNGLNHGLRSKLEEGKKNTIKKRAEEKSGAVSAESLVEKYQIILKREEEKLAEAVEDYYPNLRKGGYRRISANYDKNVADDGYSHGKNINVGGKVAGLLR